MNQHLLVDDHGDFRTDFPDASYSNSKTDSHSGAKSIFEVNPDSAAGANCDSQIRVGSRATPESAWKSTPESVPESTPELESIPTSESAPELIMNTDLESSRSDSELPPLVHSSVVLCSYSGGKQRYLQNGV